MTSRLPEHKRGGTQCQRCQHGTYDTRRAARRAARRHHPNDPGLNAFRCPFGNGWHYGHDNPWLRDQPDHIRQNIAVTRQRRRSDPLPDTELAQLRRMVGLPPSGPTEEMRQRWYREENYAQPPRTHPRPTPGADR